MATVRDIDVPKELSGARAMLLSPDGKTVACRLDGAQAGLWAFDVGGVGRPLKRDQDGRTHQLLGWSDYGDLLYRVEGLPDPLLGVLPAHGRGANREYPGAGLAVSRDGRVLAIADVRARALLVAIAGQGNSPFHEPLQGLAALDDTDEPVELAITRDSRHVLLVRHKVRESPSLWSVAIDGGQQQELVSEIAGPASLSVALARDQIAILEVRRGIQPSSRVMLRPIAAGSLGLLRLGPARDLLFVRQSLPEQRPAFSPDGKALAVLGPRGDAGTHALDIIPTGVGVKQVKAAQVADVKGTARFLETGEVVVDGSDRVSVVSL